MSVATASEYLEAIAHLPPGTTLRAHDVSWEEYEQLLADLGPAYSVRIFYDHGRMEIMAPTSAHERPTKIIHRLVTALSDELDIDIESLGATTLKRQMEEAGAEPDDSYYVQHAAAIIDKLDITLATDPPPDIVVESDHTSSSLDKFAIYAALGVPEIWRITNRNVRIWLRQDSYYQEAEMSQAFPFLSAQTISEFMGKGLREGSRKAAKAFRTWIRENQPKPV